MRMPTERHLAPGWAVFGLLLSYLVVACDAPVDATLADAPAKDAGQPTKLELRDDTKDLLLTWVDERGDFHVVRSPSEVPEKSREWVRVVVASRREGTGSLLYVADLRRKNPDGTYPLRTMPRADWDEVGAAKRKARLEALEPKDHKSGPGAADEVGSVSAAIKAIVYGAQWCKPCHDAARYLRTLGVEVTVKDIESSGAIRAELERKLTQAHMPSSSSIPIIDVMGKVLVGFDPRALDRAVRDARRRQ